MAEADAATDMAADAAAAGVGAAISGAVCAVRDAAPWGLIVCGLIALRIAVYVYRVVSNVTQPRQLPGKSGYVRKQVTGDSLPDFTYFSIAVLTVPDGERVQTSDGSGRVEQFDGPKRMWMVRSHARRMERVTAEPTECIRIVYHDGRRVHRPGPEAVWFDPVAMREVAVVQPISLMTGEALVVYRKDGNSVERKIIQGPSLHLPEESEWTHEFSWHGRKAGMPEGTLESGLLKFKKLRTLSDKLYFNIEGVRSNDDALVTVKLMVFYTLKDINKMLDSSRDAIADIINSVTGDVVEHTSRLTFEQFKEQNEALNEMSTYRSLVARAESIGYVIDKIVFRGYESSRSLQQMHDRAIEQRTQLQLSKETEERQQSLADYKQACEGKRKEEERRQMFAEREHRQRLLDMEAEGERKRKAAEAGETIRQQEEEHKQLEQHLQRLGGAGIDVTQYAISLKQGTPRALYSFQNPREAQVHVHPS